MNSLNSVDVWLLDKIKASTPLSFSVNLLSEEEQQRANRFHFEKDREDFIFYHAAKRIIFSYYLNIPPRKIEISILANGKPFFEDSALHFNLSHTKNSGILAVSKNIELGVDIEKIKTTASYLDIAKRFFHPDEYKYLEEIQEERLKKETFFVFWTAKEAILKATGEGISAGLNNFFVQPKAFSSQELIHSYPRDISLVRLDVPIDYVATLACFGGFPSLVYRDLSAI